MPPDACTPPMFERSRSARYPLAVGLKLVERSTVSGNRTRGDLGLEISSFAAFESKTRDGVTDRYVSECRYKLADPQILDRDRAFEVGPVEGIRQCRVSAETRGTSRSCGRSVRLILRGKGTTMLGELVEPTL